MSDELTKIMQEVNAETDAAVSDTPENTSETAPEASEEVQTEETTSDEAPATETPSEGDSEASASTSEITAAQEAVSEADKAVEASDIPEEKKEDAKQKIAEQRYVAKIDGKEEEVTLEQLIASYQKGKAADKKFEEAAKTRKDAENHIKMATEFKKLLKENPRALLLHPEIGHSPEKLREFAENFLKEQLEEEQMTPEQKRLKELEQQVQNYEEEKKLAEVREREARIESLRENYEKEFEADIPKALSKYGLPASPKTVDQMAAYKISFLERGEDISWEKAAEKVKNDFMSWQSELYGPMDGQKLLEVLGPDLSEKIRKTLLAKAKATKPTISSKVAETPKANADASTKKPDRHLMSDVMSEIRKEVGLED